MDSKNIIVNLADGVAELMEERGIRAEDVKAVVAAAENGGDKLLSGETGNFLAKLRLENLCVYAEYSMDGDTATVCDSYAHRVTLGSEN